LYWAVLWQACMALPSAADARRFCALTGGARLLKKLVGYPSGRVSITALLGAVCPEVFFVLARKLGASRSFLKQMSRAEADELLLALGRSGGRTVRG